MLVAENVDVSSWRCERLFGYPPAPAGAAVSLVRAVCCVTGSKGGVRAMRQTHICGTA